MNRVIPTKEGSLTEILHSATLSLNDRVQHLFSKTAVVIPTKEGSQVFIPHFATLHSEIADSTKSMTKAFNENTDVIPTKEGSLIAVN